MSKITSWLISCNKKDVELYQFVRKIVKKLAKIVKFCYSKAMPNAQKTPKPHSRQIGTAYECQAVEFLVHQGLTVIAKNFAIAKVGEIDIIATDDRLGSQVLVFIEVKMRKSANFGNASGSVTLTKQKRIIKTAQYFLSQNPQFDGHDCRFDVLSFDGVGEHQAVEWLQGAFLVN